MNDITTLAPRSLDEAIRFSELLAKSTIVPKEYQGNPGNVLVAVQWGAELGLAPLQAMQSIAVINGRPSVWGDTVLALVRGSGKLEYIEETQDEQSATCTVKRVGEPPVTRRFTVEAAKRAGLWQKAGPWQSYPQRMLQMRARAWALRDAFADILRGLSVAEEVQDIPATEPRQQAPASPAEKVAAALRRQRAEPVEDVEPAPQRTVEDVVQAIAACTTLEGLTECAALAADLPDEDKPKAREAYAKRKAELESE